MPLSYDELAAQYRASLRREVQLNDLAQMKREQRAQQTGHELDRIAHEARPAIHHNGVAK